MESLCPDSVLIDASETLCITARMAFWKNKDIKKGYLQPNQHLNPEQHKKPKLNKKVIPQYFGIGVYSENG